MNPIEQAIRNALNKGDETDPLFRKRVYSSAGAAMERSLKERGLSQSDIATRRAHMASVIADVEASYRPQQRHAPEPSLHDQRLSSADDALSSLEAVVSAPHADGRLVNPVHQDAYDNVRHEPRIPDNPELFDRTDNPDGELDHVPIEAKSIRTRRGRFAILLGIVIVIVALLMMVWWIVSTGIFTPADPNSGPVPNPRNEQPEDYAGEAPPKLGEASASDDRNWIVVFSAADPSGIQVSDGAKAQLVTLNGISGVQISASAAEHKIGFPVGQGALQSLVGKTVVFDIIARTINGDTGVPIAITCDFAELGDCVRKRYEIGLEFTEYLFSVDFPSANPSSGGWIYIEPDLEGEGRGILIERIRVAVQQ